jgi:hypothetical protein
MGGAFQIAVTLRPIWLQSVIACPWGAPGIRLIFEIGWGSS